MIYLSKPNAGLSLLTRQLFSGRDIFATNHQFRLDGILLD